MVRPHQEASSLSFKLGRRIEVRASGWGILALVVLVLGFVGAEVTGIAPAWPF